MGLTMTNATKWLLVVCLGSTVVAARPAVADRAPNERACQVGRGRAVYDMIAAEGSCIRRCRDRAGADCRLPDGADVARCLAAAKARALREVFGRPCRRACPACYGGCGPDVASGEVEYSTGLVTTFASVVYCAATRVATEARCTDRVARAAGWFARQYGRCFTRCHAAGCDGAGPGDARTRACADRAAGRAIAAIAARCVPARGGTPPPCHAGLTGAEWIGLVRGAVDQGRPVIFCR